MIATHCQPSFNSVLDFTFVSGTATEWSPTSTILMAQPGFCPDDNTMPDHRPLMATFDLSGSEQSGLRQSLLERITAIERELEELRHIVEDLEE